MCDEEGEGKGEEEAWLRGAHISPVSHPHSTERL